MVFLHPSEKWHSAVLWCFPYVGVRREACSIKHVSVTGRTLTLFVVSVIAHEKGNCLVF